MISLTGEYALRAMIYLQRHRADWPISGRKIAEQADIPGKYLSTILADLVRAGLLEATRGKLGGFRVAKPAGKITLADVIDPFEPIVRHRRVCPFGNVVCSDEDPCGAHAQWRTVKATLDRFLERMTLRAVASKGVERGNGRVRSRRLR